MDANPHQHQHQPRDQQTIIPSTTCVDAIVAAGGDVALAAERLHIDSTVIIASIASDPTAPPRLAAQLRTLSILHMYDTFRKTKLLMDASLPELEAPDMAKFYSDMAKQVATITDDKTNTTNLNVYQEVAASLPPAARHALSEIVGAARNYQAAPRSTSSSAITPPDDDDEDEAA